MVEPGYSGIISKQFTRINFKILGFSISAAHKNLKLFFMGFGNLLINKVIARQKNGYYQTNDYKGRFSHYYLNQK